MHDGALEAIPEAFHKDNPKAVLDAAHEAAHESFQIGKPPPKFWSRVPNRLYRKQKYPNQGLYLSEIHNK